MEVLQVTLLDKDYYDIGAEVTITNKELGFCGTFANPWSLAIEVNGPIMYEVGPLLLGAFNNAGTFVREIFNTYALLDIHKIDWIRNPQGIKEPIVQEEVNELQDVLRSIKGGFTEVEDKNGEKIFKEYFTLHKNPIDERIDFLIPRIAYIPRSYIPGTTYARAKTIEGLLRSN